jgi:light-harvesting complex II chlorophyll a/b binding protein 7
MQLRSAHGAGAAATAMEIRRPPAISRSLARAICLAKPPPTPTPSPTPCRAPRLADPRSRPLTVAAAAGGGGADPNDDRDKSSSSSNDTTTTRLARLAAEAVASPVFYLLAGLVAVKLVASTGEQASSVLVFAALPVTLLTALSKSPLGASVQASLEAKLPELEREADEARRAAAEARRASPFFGARRPLLPPSVGGGRAPWLDGSLAGDYGFDPLGFSAPDAGADDGSTAGATAATGTTTATNAKTTTTPSPRADALAAPAGNAKLARMAEAELLHARWAMLGALGCLVPEALSLVWGVDVGPEARWWAVGGAKLRGDFDFEWGGIKGFHIAGKQGIGVIALCQLFLMGGPEYARQVGIRSLEPVGVFLPGDSNYPGGAPFDPLGLADEGEAFARLATSEVRHGRVAMVAMVGYAAQALVTRKGPVENLLDWWGGLSASASS